MGAAASAYPDVNGEISIPLESVQVYTSITETAASFGQVNITKPVSTYTRRVQQVKG